MSTCVSSKLKIVAVAIEKGKTYTIKITEVRKSTNTYVITGDFV